MRGADMADDTQDADSRVLLDEWYVAIWVDPLLSSDEVEAIRRRVTVDLSLWADGVAGRLGVPTSRLRVDVGQ
jgi:hypothetical protein